MYSIRLLADQCLLKRASLHLATRKISTASFTSPCVSLAPTTIATPTRSTSTSRYRSRSNDKDHRCNYNIRYHYHASAQISRERSPKVYEQEEINEINNDMDKISKAEQERIKIELLTYTGTDDVHNHLLDELSAQTKILSNLLDDNGDGRDNCDGGNDGNNIATSTSTSNEGYIIQKMQNVAKIHWELGMLDDAQSLQEDILHRLIQLHSDSNTDDNNSDNEGDGEKIKRNSQKQKKSPLPTHLDIAQTLHTIGSIQNRMNQSQEARRWFEAARKMKEEILTSKKEDGGEGFDYHYEIGKTLNGIALAEIQLAEDVGEGKDASVSSVSDILKMLESAESHYIFHGEGGDNTSHYFDDELYEGDSMADHPHVASINANMAMLYRQNGNYQMAAAKYEEALRIQMMWTSTEDGDNSGGNATIVGLRMDLGDCYKAYEKYERALENYEEALRLHMVDLRKERQRQRQAEKSASSAGGGDGSADKNETEKNDSSSAVLDPNTDVLNSPIEAVLRHNIGLMHANLGRHEIAMEEYQSSLKIKRRLDETNPDIALTLNGIGALQATRGNFKSALAYFREALYIYELHSPTFYGLGGDDNDDIVMTKKNIELVEKQSQMYDMGGSGNRN